MSFNQDNTFNKILYVLGVITTIGGFIQLVVGLLGEKIFFGFFLIFMLAAAFFFLWRRKREIGNWSIFPNQIDNSDRISAEQATAMLRGLLSSDRVDALVDIFPRLANDLSGQEVNVLLKGMLSSDRVEGIRILSPKIRRNLTKIEIDLILQSLLSSDREEAVAILSGARRVAHYA